MKENQNKQETTTEPKNNSSQTSQSESGKRSENEETIKSPTPKTEQPNGKKEVEIPEKDHEHEFKEPLGQSNDSDHSKNVKKMPAPPLPNEANQKSISGGPNKKDIPAGNQDSKQSN